MTLYALTDLGHQYLLYGDCRGDLPGRLRDPDPQPGAERLRAGLGEGGGGFLSLFVLAALVIGGVVIGLAVVYYYTDIVNFINGSWIPRRSPRDNGRMPSSTSNERAGLLDALSEAVESGAGLPAVARAAARLLDASVALIDRSSAVLAVAGASSDQEQKLLSGGEGVTTVELRVADTAVGELRYRAKAAPDPVIARMVTTLLALELERSRSPEWESEEAAGAFVARGPASAR